MGELASALAKAQGAMHTVAKKKVGKIKGESARGAYEYSYNYADLSEVVETIQPSLTENGLSVTQHIEGIDQQVLTTILLHSSGQFMESSMRLFLKGSDSQSQGSAVTYARRYAYCAVLGVVADADDDGAAAVEAPTTRSTGVQPGSQAAKAGNPASDAQWKFLAKLTKQTVEETRAQYGEMNAAACSTLIDSLKETAA